jgi:YHS domain-containing protein
MLEKINPVGLTDPVCGMEVGHDAELSVDYLGVRYWFCDPACADTFRDEPERWIDAAAPEGLNQVHHH